MKIMLLFYYIAASCFGGFFLLDQFCPSVIFPELLLPLGAFTRGAQYAFWGGHKKNFDQKP